MKKKIAGRSFDSALQLEIKNNSSCLLRLAAKGIASHKVTRQIKSLFIKVPPTLVHKEQHLQSLALWRAAFIPLKP